ncbi:MAG: DUF1080 domain-containing protein [Gemmatimonadota bacterium]|nr:DUF1080 domain-containing protein [Gemmatimonadota bacterium]
MHRSVATLALLLGALVAPGTASCQRTVELKPGYEQILRQVNGRYTKHGWNHYGPGYFDLDPETGVLTARGGMGLFWHAGKAYGDFVLELEFKTPDIQANSGVFVRVPGVPVSDDYIYHSFEVQIDDKSEGIHHTGGVYDAEAPSHHASRPPGQWNHLEITFQGNHVTVAVNGQTVVNWDAEPRGKVRDFAPRGYIGLQNHDDQSAVQFRNIYVKELPAPSR